LLTYLDFGSLFFWDVAHHQWLQTTQWKCGVYQKMKDLSYTKAKA